MPVYHSFALAVAVATQSSPKAPFEVCMLDGHGLVDALDRIPYYVEDNPIIGGELFVKADRTFAYHVTVDHPDGTHEWVGDILRVNVAGEAEEPNYLYLLGYVA